MKVNLYKTSSGFNTGVSEFNTNAQAIDKQAHRLLCSALYLACPALEGDRNVDRVRRVLNCFPKSGRRKAAIHWCKEHAPLTIVENAKSGEIEVKMRKDAPKEWTFNVEQAMATPFWSLTKEKDPAPLRPLQAIAQTAKRIRAAIEGKGNTRLEGDPEVAERVLAGLDNMLAEIQA